MTRKFAGDKYGAHGGGSDATMGRIVMWRCARGNHGRSIYARTIEVDVDIACH